METDLLVSLAALVLGIGVATSAELMSPIDRPQIWRSRFASKVLDLTVLIIGFYIIILFAISILLETWYINLSLTIVGLCVGAGITRFLPDILRCLGPILTILVLSLLFYWGRTTLSRRDTNPAQVSTNVSDVHSLPLPNPAGTPAEINFTEVPLANTVKEIYPKEWEGLVRDIEDDLSNGKSRNDAVAKVRIAILKRVRKALEHGPSVLVNLWFSNFAKEVNALASQPDAICFDFLRGHFPNAEKAIGILPRELVDGQLRLEEMLLRATPINAQASLPRKEDGDRIANRVLARFGLDTLLMWTAKTREEKVKGCNVFVYNVTQILELPPERAAPQLRQLATYPGAMDDFKDG